MPAFLTAWKAENARRELAVSQRQPIYGPVQHTEANYFTYLAAELTTNLQAVLVKTDAITVTDSALHQYYLAHPTDFQLSTAHEGQDLTVTGPVAPPTVAPFDQVKAQVQQEYVQQQYDAYITKLSGAAVVHVDQATIAAVPVD